jgi:hypothetical protein
MRIATTKEERAMRGRARVVLPAVALAAVIGWAVLPGFAQTMMSPQGMTSAPMPRGMPLQPGMMGRDGMMMGGGGMMVEHVEGRIAFLKTELKITEAQTAQWERFADALRSTAGSMNGMHQQMMQAGMPATLPARLDLQEKMLLAHLEALKGMRAALDPLYASLSDEQKKIADELMLGPMGMM